MNWRTTGALFLLLLLLGGAVYVQRERLAPAPTPRPTPAFMAKNLPLLPGVAVADVARLEIMPAPAGEPTLFVQEKSGWRGQTLEGTGVSGTSVATALQSLLDEGSRRTLPASANPPAVYGLDAPAVTIVVAVRREATVTRHTLLVGNRTPAGDAYYLQKAGDARIYVVPTFPIDNLLALLPSPLPDS